MGALAGEVRAAPGAATLAARYGAARGFLGQEAHLSHPYRPRAVAANLLVRRTAFEQIGGFYEGVRAAEDTDFSWRLQAAGWKLELRRRARRRAPLPDDASGICAASGAVTPPAARGWDAAIRASSPSRRLRRASSRAWRRLRRKPADRRRTASREATRVGRLERGGYAMLDAVLSAEELAGLMMSNRPTGTRTPPARVVLIADRFPARGDPLAEFADTLDGARIEASARPESLEIGPVRSLPVAYREDDGVAARALAVLGLALAHPLRCAADRLGRAPDQPALAAIAPAVRRLRRDPGAGVHPLGAAHRGDRAANRAARGPAAGRAMSVHVVDPSSFTRPYDHGLCSALARAGAEVELITCEFPYGTAPSPDGYVLREPFYRHALGPGGSRLRRMSKLAEHVPDMLRYRGAARVADVVHFQWLDVQWFDRYLLPDRPRRAHRPRPAAARAAPRPGARAAPAVRRRRRGRRALRLRTRPPDRRSRGRGRARST